MTTDALLTVILLGLQHTQELAAVYNRAVAEKRDLTDDEVAAVHAKALAANEKLKAQS